MILFQRFKCPDLFNTGRARKQQRHIHDWIYRRGNRSSGKMIPLQLPIEDKNFYKDLLYELNNFFKGKCAFCECLFVEKGPGEFTQNPTLLYYRPVTKYKNKTPNYIWLSWQWSNMYLACETCSKYYNGEVPSNYPENDNPRTFPTISGIHAEPGVFGIKELVEKESPYYLDPCLDNPAGYLRFIWQEAKNQVDIEAIGDGERGQKTIKAFGLDRPELCESRAIELAKFRTRFEHVLDLAAKGESKELSSATKSLFNGCKPDQPFAGMKRQFLLEWINNDIKTSSWLAKWQTDIKEIEDWQSNPLREFPPICPKLDTRSSTSLESSDTIEKPKIDVLQDVSLGYDESETGKIKLILRKMFKNYERVMVKKEFGEGFSAGHVFLVGAISQTGQGDLPAVVKIGPSNLIKQEAYN